MHMAMRKYDVHLHVSCTGHFYSRVAQAMNNVIGKLSETTTKQGNMIQLHKFDIILITVGQQGSCPLQYTKFYISKGLGVSRESTLATFLEGKIQKKLANTNKNTKKLYVPWPTNIYCVGRHSTESCLLLLQHPYMYMYFITTYCRRHACPLAKGLGVC